MKVVNAMKMVSYEDVYGSKNKTFLYSTLLIVIVMCLLSFGCTASSDSNGDNQDETQFTGEEAQFTGSVRDVAILARDRVELQDNSAVIVGGPRHVGDIVVAETLSGGNGLLAVTGVRPRETSLLSAGNEVHLSVGDGVAVIGDAASVNHVAAESIRVGRSASVDADAWFDNLENDGVITGMLHSPLGNINMADVPPFPAGAPGATDITVAPGDSLTISSHSDYGDIVVQDGASLTIEFTDGRVDARSIRLGDRANLFVAATGDVEIWVQDKWMMGVQAQIGPALSTPGIGVSNIIIYVADAVNPDVPPAVGIGGESRVRATIYVDLRNRRGGMLTIGAYTQVTGALLAPQVVVGRDAVVRFASFFDDASSGEASPEINVGPQVFNIDENSANSAVVGVVVATGSNGGELSYAIVGGSGNTAFAIDPVTGEITVADSGQLDFEATPSLTLDVQVDGGDSGISQATMTIDINDINEAPTIDNQAFNVDENVADGTSLGGVSASDPDAGDTLAFAITGGDAGNAFAIDSSSGEITVNNPPGLDFELFSVFNLTVQVEDSGQLMDTATVTINVNDIVEVIAVNTPPGLGAIGNQSVDELATLSFTASASDADAPAQTLSFSLDAAALANGMSIDASSGVFSWTPTELQGGSVYNATITVTDNGVNPPTLSASETISITVNDVNTAPTLGAIGNQSLDELSTLNVTATASDVDNPAQSLSFSLDAAALANGMSIDASSGVFSWTPTELQGGSVFNATITVTDNGVNPPTLSDSETISITVNEINTAPSLTAIGNQSVDELSTLNFTATASDTDDPANTLTFSLSGAVPAGASITPAGVFSWTPTESQGPGTFTFDVVVTDDGNPNLADSETITVTVNEVNTAVTLGAIGNQSIDELSTLGFTAVASDADNPAQSLSFSLDAAALANGMSIDASSGVFSWTPTELQGGSVFNATITVTDNGVNPPTLSDSETISITVNEINTAPSLTAIGNQSVDELSTLNFTATASDTDDPANTLTFSLSGAVPAGASITPAGVFSWTPTESQGPGLYTFDVVVTDNGSPNLADSETIAVTVNEVNVAPQIVSAPITTGTADQLYTYDVNAADADLPVNALTYSLDTAPAGMSIDPNSGLIQWTPSGAQVGNHAVTARVADVGGLFDTQSFSIQVDPATTPPSAVNDGSFDALGNVGINVPAGSGVMGNDTLGVPTATITAFDATSVNGGAITMNATTGAFTYTPPAGFEGADSFTYTLGNAGGASVATVTLNVAGMIWFVDASVAPGGDGRVSSPFNDLAVTASSFDVNAADAAGDAIFLADGNYSGGLTLLTNQILIGDGSSSDLATLLSLSVPSFSNPLPVFSNADPIITSAVNGISLGVGNTIRGLTIGNTTGAGLSGVNVGTASVAEVSINGLGVGVDINTGALAFSFDEISSSNATGVNLSNVGGSFAVASGSIASGTLPAVNIAGNPVNLNVTLTSVSVNGAANGVNINNTTGSFTVTGDGGSATQGGNDTGGVIQNTSGDGVVLSNTENITLRNMTIGDATATPADSADNVNLIGDDGVHATNVTNLNLLNVTLARVATHGVHGVNVTNFTLDNSLVLNAGDAQEENGLDFTELRGDNFVANSFFDAFNETGIEVMNSSGAVDLTIDDTTFQDNQSTVGNAGEEAILLVASGTAEIVALITGDPDTNLTNSIFDDIKSQGVQAISEGTASNIELTVENSRFLEHNAGDAIIIMNPDNAGDGNVTVRNNFFTDDTLGAFALLAKNDSSGTLDVTVQGNTATNVQLMSINHDNLGSGGAANGTSRALIGGIGAGEGNINTVGSSNIGISVLSTETGPTGASPDVSLTILNNTVTMLDGFFTFQPGIMIDAQQNTRMNVDIQGNTSNSDPTCCGGEGLGLRTLDSAVVGIAGLTGGVPAFLNGLNTFTGPYTLIVAGSANFVAGNPVLPTATTRPNP